MAVTGSFDFEFLPRPSRLFDGAALPRHRRLIVNFQSKNLACSGRRSTKIRNIDCTVWPNRHRRRNYEPYQYLFHFARRVDANELRVISRTSVMQFKGVHRPRKDPARELGVDGILEGSVLNSDGRVRVTVQLVHAASDTHVWAPSYIRDSRDLLLLQQELAENVAKEVHSAALPPKPSRKIAPEAHDAYLRGRYNLAVSGTFTHFKSRLKALFRKG